MNHPRKIAIDGPAGSGKSTLGRHLAQELGYVFLDAGMVYRAITWSALKKNLDVHHEASISRFADKMHIRAKPVPPTVRFQINACFACDLNTPAIDAVVPIVAAYKAVRERVRLLQHQIAEAYDVVYVGRDIGTVVLPDADLKIFLDISLEERTQRRAAQSGRDIELVREELLLRDLADTTRHESPMQVAADALLIQSDDLSVGELLELVLAHLDCLK
jgi:cytidylate kinase